MRIIPAMAIVAQYGATVRVNGGRAACHTAAEIREPPALQARFGNWTAGLADGDEIAAVVAAERVHLGDAMPVGDDTMAILLTPAAYALGAE